MVRQFRPLLDLPSPMVEPGKIFKLIEGPASAPKPQIANPTTGRKIPPPAPSTRPTRSSGAAKPPPPPAPPIAKTQVPAARTNLAANLADIVIFNLSRVLIS